MNTQCWVDFHFKKNTVRGVYIYETIRKEDEKREENLQL